jgi:hypothetical protein
VKLTHLGMMFTCDNSKSVHEVMYLMMPDDIQQHVMPSCREVQCTSGSKHGHQRPGGWKYWPIEKEQRAELSH